MKQILAIFLLTLCSGFAASATPAWAGKEKALQQIDKNLEKHGGTHKGLEQARSSVSKETGKDHKNADEILEIEPSSTDDDVIDEAEAEKVKKQRDLEKLKERENMSINTRRKSDRTPYRGRDYYGR